MAKKEAKKEAKKGKSKVKRVALTILLVLVVMIVVGVIWIGWGKNQGEQVTHEFFGLDAGDTSHDASTVYMTSDISPEGLEKVYEALGYETHGKVAVKLHTGEGENSYYLRPDFIKDFVQGLDATIVECNTAYGGSRINNELHQQVIEERGFLDVAPVDLMDSEGSMAIPVTGGSHLQENLVGSHLADYDDIVVLSHFKGHMMGGFGGAIKNTSIGIASAEGKGYIHTGGANDSFFFGYALTPQNSFLESMAEAAKSVSDYENNGDNIIYISVVNNISVDCDCVANPTEPDMHDIGILASRDPVALDQACVDLIYSAPDGASVIERIESRNGLLTLKHAEEIGLGTRYYQLVSIDKVVGE